MARSPVLATDAAPNLNEPPPTAREFGPQHVPWGVGSGAELVASRGDGACCPRSPLLSSVPGSRLGPQTQAPPSPADSEPACQPDPQDPRGAALTDPHRHADNEAAHHGTAERRPAEAAAAGWAPLGRDLFGNPGVQEARPRTYPLMDVLDMNRLKTEDTKEW